MRGKHAGIKFRSRKRKESDAPWHWHLRPQILWFQRNFGKPVLGCIEADYLQRNTSNYFAGFSKSTTKTFAQFVPLCLQKCNNHPSRFQQFPMHFSVNSFEIQRWTLYQNRRFSERRWWKFVVISLSFENFGFRKSYTKCLKIIIWNYHIWWIGVGAWPNKFLRIYRFSRCSSTRPK